jgi:hypothetical protein
MLMVRQIDTVNPWRANGGGNNGTGVESVANDEWRELEIIQRRRLGGIPRARHPKGTGTVGIEGHDSNP